jgi:predicted enzyme related to lactoylglutathione lyase
VHVEIPAVNPTAASAFYGDVFGWQITTDMPDYPMFRAEGGPAGGFVQISYGSHAAPIQNLPRAAGEVLVFLSTDDIEATLTQVEAHGGKGIMPRTEIPGIGWWAVFADPSGNRLALFTPMPAAGAEQAESAE